MCTRIKQIEKQIKQMLQRKKMLATMAATLVWCAVAMAVPALPVPCTHVQSDGTTLTLMMRGGKFNHHLTTLDGLTVAPNAAGDYCYLAGGALSDVMAHDQGRRSIEEQAFVVAYRDQMTLAAAARRVPRRADGADHPQVPTMGSPRIPVILVNYTDVKFIDEDPVATFQNQFNLMDKSSLHYFQAQSRGQFSPQFDILGPVQLAETRAYYGTNVRGYDAWLGTMIIEACEGMDSVVNYGDYDNDGDGLVDVVVVLYPGVGEAQAWRTVPESVWPCQWDMEECYDWGYSPHGAFPLDGVVIDKFAVFNELEGNSNYSTELDGIGTFCHEFGHCLGLPDFYPTNGGNAFGMGSWDIMDYGCYLDGGHTPAGYTSYERWFMGWMDLTEARENTFYSLAPLQSDDGNAVKVTNDANPDEYYLLEYRTRTGWDAYLPGEGILVLHVDYDKEAWDANSPNNISSHQRMTIIPADGVLSGSGGSTDTWPQAGLDSLTDNSVPAAKVFTGGYMGKPITAMSVDPEAGTASFWHMRGMLSGDLNGDGEVTVADVGVLIDVLIGGQSPAARTDVNRDGEITVADVGALIDLILTAA